MTRQIKSLFLSVLFHGMLLFSIYAVSNSSAQVNPPPIVIDFDVTSAKRIEAAPGPPEVRSIPEKTHQITFQEPLKTEPVVVERPLITAVEPSGPAAILAPPPTKPVVTAQREATAKTEVSAPGSSAEGSVAPRTPAGAASVENLRKKYVKEHFAYINDLIQKGIYYPARARKMGWSGKVVVSFIINETGQVSNERVVASSGFALLDNNVINSIRAVAPFPPPPVKAELHIPVTYRLE